MAKFGPASGGCWALLALQLLLFWEPSKSWCVVDTGATRVLEPLCGPGMVEGGGGHRPGHYPSGVGCVKAGWTPHLGWSLGPNIKNLVSMSFWVLTFSSESLGQDGASLGLAAED